MMRRKPSEDLQLITDCVELFGWEADVATYAIMMNKTLIQGLVTQHKSLLFAEADIERVFSTLLHQGERK